MSDLSRKLQGNRSVHFSAQSKISRLLFPNKARTQNYWHPEVDVAPDLPRISVSIISLFLVDATVLSYLHCHYGISFNSIFVTKGIIFSKDVYFSWNSTWEDFCKVCLMVSVWKQIYLERINCKRITLLLKPLRKPRNKRKFITEIMFCY